MDLNTLSTIVSLVILGATYLILQPLKASIVGLQASVDKLANALEQLRLDVSDNDEATARIGEKVKSAHERINRLDTRIGHLENKCEHCTCK